MILVELPWVSQIEICPTFGSLPSLIPSNAQQIYSTVDSDSCSNDIVLLGFSVLTPSTSLSHIPRLLILISSVVPEEPGPDANIPEGGWDICDVWETMEIDLNRFVATNEIVERYSSDVKDFWDYGDFARDEVQPKESLSTSSQTNRFRHELHQLGISLASIGFLPSMFVNSDKTDKRIFTFKVSQKKINKFNSLYIMKFPM